jgi:hypothetical protein
MTPGAPQRALEGPITVQVNPGPFQHRVSVLERIFVERGSVDDWHALKALHYKSSGMGVGPTFMRAVLDHEDGAQETIGVMMLTVPKVLDAGRNEAFPHLKPNQRGGIDPRLVQQMRVKWINANMRLSARNVIDTMYRGAGVGYRFRNLAFRLSGYRFLEGRSSMSRYNPFYFKAGMKAVKPRTASGLEAGLAMFARNFRSPAYDVVAILEELQSMPEHVRARVLEDMRAHYYRVSAMEKSGDKRLEGKDRVAALPVPYLLKQILQLTFGSTIYAIYANPDHGRVLPARLPLSAFDLQGPNEPLRLDLLP